MLSVCLTGEMPRERVRLGGRVGAAAKAVRLVRRLIYLTPFYRLLPERRATGAEWDAALAGDKSPYLKQRIGSRIRDSITIALIGHCAPAAKSVLDVGCGGGWIGRSAEMRGLSRYVGVDISRVAIEAAREGAPAFARFEVSPLEGFETAKRFDAVVFNEVLYYLSADAAVEQVGRYAGMLESGGIVVISMKDDPKSRAIYRMLAERHTWLEGALYQAKTSPGWRVVENRERPGFLVAAFRPGR